MNWIRLLLVIFICEFSTGCNGLMDKTDGEVERTYPSASDFPQTTLEKIINNPPDSANYNIQVYVLGINECPQNARCELPDGISISDGPNAGASNARLHLSATQPRQFKVGSQYIMSIAIESQGYENPTSGKPVLFLELVGYDEVENLPL